MGLKGTLNATNYNGSKEGQHSNKGWSSRKVGVGGGGCIVDDEYVCYSVKPVSA